MKYLRVREQGSGVRPRRTATKTGLVLAIALGLGDCEEGNDEAPPC